jgi:two-component system cell cycle sensor histidine kinase/response regulator CckA
MKKCKPIFCIFSISILFALLFWVADSLQDYLYFTDRIRFLIFQSPISLTDSLIFNIPPHDLFVRIFFGIACLIGAVIVSIFLTIIKKRNIEQQFLKDQLFKSQKLEVVGTLASGIAHDFNNLLTGVLGYTQLMLYDKSEDDPDYEKLQKIVYSVDRGSQLTNRLLTISSKFIVKSEPLDLNDHVIETKNLLQSVIPKMIEIKIDISSDQLIVEADSGQLEQVLMNLVLNAKYAMVMGGKITISTKAIDLLDRREKTSDCSITSTYPPAGHYALLTITDTGSGMEKDVLDLIFDPFFTTREMGKGSGLGLAMVYEIIKGHSAYMVCSSILGVGTTFDIYFQISTKETKRKTYLQTSDSIIPGNETILVVDDEPDVRYISKLTFERKGYNVITADSGEKALKIYNKNKIDLIILDIIMPGMGGVECLTKLFEIDSDVKVIMSSGFCDDDSKKVLRLGAMRFIRKPFNLDKLLAEAREVLDE